MVQPLLDRPGTSTTDRKEHSLMAPPDDADSLGVLAHRVGSLELTVKDMRDEMRGGFAGLSFVRTDVYQSERTAAREYAEETRRIAEHSRSVSTWTLVFVLSALGALLAVIRAVAG